MHMPQSSLSAAVVVQHIPILRAVYCVALEIQRPKGAKFFRFPQGSVVVSFRGPRCRGPAGRGGPTRVRQGARSEFLRHTATEGTFCGSSWTRSRQLGALQKLSGSRWVRLGPASQAVVVPAFCGLDDPLSFIRSKVGALLSLGWFCTILGGGRSSWHRPPLCAVAVVEAGSSVIAAAHVSYHCIWRRARSE